MCGMSKEPFSYGARFHRFVKRFWGRKMSTGRETLSSKVAPGFRPSHFNFVLQMNVVQRIALCGLVHECSMGDLLFT